MLKKPGRLLSLFLCLAMLAGLLPTAAFAEESEKSTANVENAASVNSAAIDAQADWETRNTVYDGTTFGTNGYYNVISKKEWTLVPGAAVESEMVLNNANGSRRQVLHIIELDSSSPDISVLPGYYGIDKDLSDKANWKAAGVTDVAEYYDATLGYRVVGAMNTDLDYSDNAPRVLAYNGKILSGYTAAAAPSSVLYVWKINDEISCQVTNYVKSEMEAGIANGTLLHAVGVSFAMVVNNGELVKKTEERTSESAARSMIGVKEDGTLVICMNDGRGANNSKGFCDFEEGEAMLALGCKWAANCDGGGSSSFVTRRAGEEGLVCRCVPCDGAERPTKTSVVVVSNVGATGVLDTVNIESDYDIFAPGTTYTFGTTAVDTNGYKMELPEDVVWGLSDDSFGSLVNGTFVSGGKLGEVTVQLMRCGNVIGEKTITIANPTTLQFARESTILPYGKSTKLEFTSLIGEAEVFLDGSCFAYSFSDPNGGALNGLVFTATTDESVLDTVITAAYLPTGQELNFSVTFGKGSEVLYDFEDGIDGWLGTDETLAWLIENGKLSATAKVDPELKGYYNSGASSDNFSASVKTRTFLSTEYVHSGNSALGVVFDMTQSDYNNWQYGILYCVNGGTVLRDVANGKKAITLGMWMRVPENFSQEGGTWANQLTVWAGTDKDHLSGTQIHFQAKNKAGEMKNINGLTEADIPDNRWIYVTATLPGSDYVQLTDAMQPNYRSPSFLRTYIKPNVCQEMTWYIDDITLDYSSAVDDRVPPTIANLQYATADTNIDFTDGVVITDVSAAFTATISDDNSGINASTAAIYVDGHKVATTQVVGSTMFCSNIALGIGTHKVKFEIANNLGNYTTLTRTIVSNTDDRYMKYRTQILLDGHNDSGEDPMPGSVYWIDIFNSYSEKMPNTVITLELNTANKWLLEGIEAKPGYDVSYTVDDEHPNTVTFTVFGRNPNSKKDTMFSVPVAVYNPLIENGTSDGTAVAVSGKEFIAPITVKMTYCDYSSYGNYAEYSILNTKRTITRHDHTATAVDDKQPTCTEIGYIGRTYCDVCDSIVNFGTVPALGHKYELVEGMVVCTHSGCGDLLTGIWEVDGKEYVNGVMVPDGWSENGDYYYLNGNKLTGVQKAAEPEGTNEYFFDFGTTGKLNGKYTGLFRMNSVSYYAIGGNLVKGWQDVDGSWYFFNNDYEGVDGELKYGSNTYTFDSGKLVSGLWVSDQYGTRYFYGPDFYRCTGANQYANVKWVEIEGEKYAFDRDGYIHTGYSIINESNNPGELYVFSETGALIEKFQEDVSGAFALPNGKLCYLNHGVPVKKGLFEYSGEYYYINSSYETVTGTYYCTTNMTPSIPAGTYEFDATGKMIDVPNRKNGVFEENGNLYYYQNDVRVRKGLVEIEEGVYYYFSYSYKALKNGTYYLPAEMMNGLLPAGNYLFENYKLIIKNGIYDENGGKYYYENNVRIKKGLVEVEPGVYYYFSMNYKALKDGTYYLPAEMMNGLLPAGNYLFENYKLIIKNGIYDEGDNR